MSVIVLSLLSPQGKVMRIDAVPFKFDVLPCSPSGEDMSVRDEKLHQIATCLADMEHVAVTALLDEGSGDTVSDTSAAAQLNAQQFRYTVAIENR